MRNETISEKREKAIIRLSEMSRNKDGGEISRARHFFNCLYRTNGRENRLLILENDYEIYKMHKSYIESLEKTQEKAIDNLREMIKEYGDDLIIYVSGGYVDIKRVVNAAGGISDTGLCFYYDRF